MPSRPFEVQKSNDHDFVPPEKLTRPKKGERLPSDLASLTTIPQFSPLHISERLPIISLPAEVNSSDPKQVFDLLWPIKVVQQIVNSTNQNANFI